MASDLVSLGHCALCGVLDRWCPAAHRDEEVALRMMRALLLLNAYEEDSKRVLRGERPIRTDYPLPLPVKT